MAGANGKLHPVSRLHLPLLPRLPVLESCGSSESAQTQTPKKSMHIELLSVAAVQPNTGAAGIALTGDSLTVKNGRGKIKVISAWAKIQATAGFVQIAFPSGHDTTRGIRVGCPASATNMGIVPWSSQIELQAQEPLSVTIAGSNAAGDLEQLCMLVRYEDLPGIAQRLMTANQLDSRFEKLCTIEMSNVATTGPSYGIATVITTPADLLQANRDYAVLGATVRTACMAVYLTGPDTGNLRIGVPGDVTKPEICAQWFPLMSRISGEACIPIINSGNKASTFANAICDENGGTFLTTWHLALLK